MTHRCSWHEHDPLALLSSVEECISQAITVFTSPPHSRSPSQIRCLGVTNQRETTVVWDTTTGLPLYNAIVWPDTRTTALVRELKQAEGADALQDICGLPLSTYPSAVKLVWLLRNVDAVKQAYNEGRLAFGTVDSWLLYRLTGGAEGNGVHVTDATNASRTMFMDLRTREYDDGLLKFFGVDREKIKLPRIVPSASADAFGAMADGPLKGIRITGCLGDQSAALVGHCGFEPGTAKNTYGTGCFLLYNVGPEPVISKSGLLGTIGYDFSGLELGHKDGKDGRRGEVAYALEGSIPVAGAGVNFLRKNLGLFDKASDIDDVTATVEDNGGVVFVTAFSGLFAPYWIDDAKGTLCECCPPLT